MEMIEAPGTFRAGAFRAGDIRRAEGTTSVPLSASGYHDARSARFPDIKLKRGDIRHRVAATNVPVGFT